MAKHVFGLASVEMGDMEADGGMGLTLAAVGETVSGTATMTTEDNQVTDFTIEESDSPVESIVTTPGKIQFAWSSYDVSGANLEKFFGGTYTAGPPSKWEAPDQFPELEVSLKLTDKKGNVVSIPRCKISGKFGLSFAKDKLGQVDLVATVLQPTKAGEKRLTIDYA